MFKIPMPEIKRKHIHIPGGWHAHVPRIDLEPCVLDAWVAYLRQQGVGVLQSRAKAQQIGQDVYVAGFRPGLLHHTAYWAKKYHKRYNTLDGFDPERVQGGYVPFVRYGRRGQPFMNSMLGEMRG